MPIVGDAIKANLEHRLLRLLIPKKAQDKDMDKLGRISIVEGH